MASGGCAFDYQCLATGTDTVTGQAMEWEKLTAALVAEKPPVSGIDAAVSRENERADQDGEALLDHRARLQGAEARVRIGASVRRFSKIYPL